jgi:starvation-inducible outer membrane lipoprotein
MNKFTVVLGITLLIQGCTYAISPELADQADRTVSFEQLLADPDLYKGKILILGGVIEQVTRKPQGVLIRLAQKPLDYWGKPVRTSRSGGWFLLFHRNVIDNVVYFPGREITAAAEVAGTKLAVLGDQEFSDPVLVVKEVAFWERQQAAPVSPEWGDPLYDRYRGHPGRPE